MKKWLEAKCFHHFVRKTATTAIATLLKSESSFTTFPLTSVAKMMNKSGRFSDHLTVKELVVILEEQWLESIDNVRSVNVSKALTSFALGVFVCCQGFFWHWNRAQLLKLIRFAVASHLFLFLKYKSFFVTNRRGYDVDGGAEATSL